jgi:hypothetical protein
MTADGRDVAVVTVKGAHGYLTAVYPVQQGYLVMMYQSLYEERTSAAATARELHEQVVRALADLGLRLVRARRRHEAEDQQVPDAESPVVEDLGPVAALA